MRRIGQCRHPHTGEVLAAEVQEGDAICVDGIAGVVTTDPVHQGAEIVLYVDGQDDIRVSPDDVLARVGRDTVDALYAEDDDAFGGW